MFLPYIAIQFVVIHVSTLLAGTALSVLTTTSVVPDKWAGDQPVMIVQAFLIFTPLWGYVGWLVSTIICHAIFPFPSSADLIAGNILGLLLGLLAGLFGYVMIVVIITGKQFNGQAGDRSERLSTPLFTGLFPRPLPH
ncbi:hypothetical protein KSC_025670 [Ktedonobacter sp. SOSP1-52]|uniref:hypothetical protein n=1 Tax=Ktedonobacter sp. SOSP1-52 TaxID=2778366 RepID=UPI001915FF07|nr:hypothetical protein KSC_025670 [Ktedonobacter sp. SOSP1-52]